MPYRILLTLLLALPFGAQAQTAAESQPAKPKIEVPPLPPLAESEIGVTIDGKHIQLRTKAGVLELRNEKNEPIAHFGFTAYFKKDPEPNRPIVFAYNGGPGSSSYWLHMGILGPRRIVVNDPGYTPGAPYTIVNNEYSLLDAADLVMMDPVGTGLSVPVGEAKFPDFWGVDQDIRSVGNFIMTFLRTYDRINAPKYLLGESYGTFRNAGVMNYLLEKGYALNGVIMVSSVFDLRTLFFAPGEDLPYIVYIPTYAATAWYHKKVADAGRTDLAAFVQQVRDFTETEYAPALYKGSRLGDPEKDMIAAKLARYTGIAAAVWKRADLRLTAGEFFQELMRDEALTVGRLDSRYKGINIDPMAQNAFTDPQSDAISPAFTAGFLDYFYKDLKAPRTWNYTTSAYGREGFKWDWTHQGNSFWGANAAVTTGPDMAEAMTRDPNVKVLILNGYFDLATVFYGVEHTIDHLGLPPSVRDNVIMKYYEAGHMMYTHLPSAARFREDVVGFIRQARR